MDLDAKLAVLHEMLSTDRRDGAVRTDQSVMVVYPPAEELLLQDRLPALWARFDAAGRRYEVLDLGSMLIEAVAAEGLLHEALRQEFTQYADVLAAMRHLPSRLVMMFPGEERDGKLYLLNQPDGFNYLAVKIS